MYRLNRQNAPGRARTDIPVLIQFGDVPFWRAFIDPLLEKIPSAGAIAVQTETGTFCDEVNTQGGCYTLLLRGKEHFDEIVRPAMIRTLLRAVNPSEDENALQELAGISTVRYLACDDSWDLITGLLYRRFRTGLPGYTLFSASPIARNGVRLRKALTDCARGLDDAAFTQWLSEKNTFVNTFCDRIAASDPGHEREWLWMEWGYEDHLIMSAEPYGLFAVETEDDLPIPETENVILTGDITPFENRKNRIMNGIKSAIAPIGYLCGCENISDCMQDTDVRTFLGHILLDELLPALPGTERAYAACVCERLGNTHILQRNLTVSARSFKKWQVRLLPVFNGTDAPPKCLTLALAALIMLYAGVRKNGNAWLGQRGEDTFPLRDDESVLRAFSRLSCDMAPESLAYAVLADTEVWGRDLRTIPGLEDALTEQLRNLQLLGLRASMRQLTEETAEKPERTENTEE